VRHVDASSGAGGSPDEGALPAPAGGQSPGLHDRTIFAWKRWPQFVHFMFTRAPGPACVNGWVFGDPQW